MNHPSHRVVSVALSTVLLVALLGLGGRCARADVVNLRTGESIKGRPLPERSDEKVLVIEDYLSGAVRSLAWDVVDRGDADRLMEEWGWKNKALASIGGHRLEQELAGGATQTIRGLIVREDETNYTVMLGGREVQVRKDSIVEKSEEEMDPRDIWLPEQLVARFVEGLKHELQGQEPPVEFDEANSRIAWRIAEYAENAEDYETAQRHYTTCANDPDFLNAGVAGQRLARVETILRDKAALETLRDIRMALSLKSFKKVRDMLAEFSTAHPDVGQALKSRVEKTQVDFERARAEYFQLEAKIDFPKIVEKMIKEKVQEKDIGLADVTAWTRRELPDLAFAELAARFARRDDAVTAEQARTFWDNRKKSGWRTVTYGSGTFIVNPAKVQPAKKSNNNPKKSAPNKGGAAPKVTIPKPPTRDQWWEQKADPKQRMYWVMAYFVENSGLFEVAEEPKWVPCVQCQGTGLESQRLQTGDTLKFICRRCAGCQNDKRVRFR